MMKNILSYFALFFIVASCSSDGAFSSDSSSLESDTSENPQGSNGGSSGQITAGEWNDLDNWPFWLNLLTNEIFSETQNTWQYYTKNRLSFIVLDNEQNSINGATIKLYKDEVFVAETMTDNHGRANLFIDLNVQHEDYKNLDDYSVSINSIPSDQDLVSKNNGDNIFYTSHEVNVEDKIEISFIVDATGSMSDEIQFLKDDLQDVISRVQNENVNSTISTSAVFYRDSGDDYLVNHSNFSSDPLTTINYIEEQNAGGGGDFPEAVHVALNTAINDLQWSLNAKTKIAFLLLDAPPHQENQVIQSIHADAKKFNKKGIKIIPVTASGIDKNTEFLMRNLAISTNGTYVFITDDSGIGNDHLEPSVGEFEVEFLNDLMVRLINMYSE